MTASKTVFTFLMTPTATVWRMSRTAKRPSGGLGESLHHHGLGGNHLNKPCITILQELGLFLKLLARSPVNLGQYLSKLNSNVGDVAVRNRGIAIFDLTRVVNDDDLGGEVGCLLSRVILGDTGWWSQNSTRQYQWWYHVHAPPSVCPTPRHTWRIACSFQLPPFQTSR